MSSLLANEFEPADDQAAIREGVHQDAGDSHVACHAQERFQVRGGAVHTARGDQAHEVQGLAVADAAHGLDQGRSPGE